MTKEENIKDLLERSKEKLKFKEEDDLNLEELQILKRISSETFDLISNAFCLGYIRGRGAYYPIIDQLTFDFDMCINNLFMLSCALLEAESHYFEEDIAMAIRLVEDKLRSMQKDIKVVQENG